ncbi:SUN domain-containing protein 3-like [Erythrolamprus reginae]|uniref:SUN domain-containing protein 3-like n=1 Tax=Erythrolamprus reginae TaxID=121349 RepID=UPI00396C4EA0
MDFHFLQANSNKPAVRNIPQMNVTAWAPVMLNQPKELAKVYETELNNLWKSQRLLEDQFHEIQDLKDEMDQIQSEISNLQKGRLQSTKQILQESDLSGEEKEIIDMVNLAFKKMFEDDIQKADWAQKSVAYTIALGFPRDLVFQIEMLPDVYPGNCWAFSGSEGQVVIKLPEKVRLTAVTVQHISKAIAFSEGITSALKDFLVYGLNDETKEEILLGTFKYDNEKELIQTFQLKNEQEKAFQYVKIKVESNWGNPEYTCIYRTRVHGRMANINHLGKKVDEIYQDK